MLLIKSFLRSVRHALAGIRYTVREERNFQIEVLVGIAVVAAAIILPLSIVERSIVVFLIGVVLSLELLNTAFERLLDMLKPRVHPYVKVVKDVVAGSVLVISLAAFIIALLIFVPALLKALSV